MRTDIDTPARRLTHHECYLHEWMVEAEARGDMQTAKALRRVLHGLSLRRSLVSQEEMDAQRQNTQEAPQSPRGD